MTSIIGDSSNHYVTTSSNMDSLEFEFNDFNNSDSIEEQSFEMNEYDNDNLEINNLDMLKLEIWKSNFNVEKNENIIMANKNHFNYEKDLIIKVDKYESTIQTFITNLKNHTYFDLNSHLFYRSKKSCTTNDDNDWILYDDTDKEETFIGIQTLNEFLKKMKFIHLTPIHVSLHGNEKNYLIMIYNHGIIIYNLLWEEIIYYEVSILYQPLSCFLNILEEQVLENNENSIFRFRLVITTDYGWYIMNHHNDLEKNIYFFDLSSCNKENVIQTIIPIFDQNVIIIIFNGFQTRFSMELLTFMEKESFSIKLSNYHYNDYFKKLFNVTEDGQIQIFDYNTEGIFVNDYNIKLNHSFIEKCIFIENTIWIVSQKNIYYLHFF